MLIMENSMEQKRNGGIPERRDMRSEDTWDLSKLFTDDKAWNEGLEKLKELNEKIEQYKGTLSRSASRLRECLEFMNEIGTLDERLGYYAFLKSAEDLGNSKNQERQAKYMQAASQTETKASFLAPEIQSIPEEKIRDFLKNGELAEFRIYLNKLLRFKPHILSEAEERLLSMQQEANQTASRSFGSLTDVDMDFGTVTTPEGEKPLSHSSFSSFMENPDRDIRKRAWDQFYQVFFNHKNTLASLYSGSIDLDIYKARVRNFPSSLASKLFPDDVPEAVYTNLVDSVNKNLPALHEYYEIRRKVLGIETLKLYDVKVPLIPEIKSEHSYEEAVALIEKALSPLGEEYSRTLRSGLLGRWVDRYENKGKRSGAFSAGSYSGDPYILMNYKNDVLRDVFTLSHEGGHSMHSYYSSAANPFQHYNYTIFEAEAASTLNEQLLFSYLMEHSDSDEMKAYLVNKRIDDILATLYRQTMFAEYELRTHQLVENGTPLSVDRLRNEYRTLLEKYFGPAVDIEDHADLEGLRVPHFYRAFYVYKYATGISASIYLADKIINGGDKERENYFTFLKSGGSRFPIDSLKAAGVDMSKPEAVNEALKFFAGLVDQLKVYLKM